jgi:hypothetical protein
MLIDLIVIIYHGRCTSSWSQATREINFVRWHQIFSAVFPPPPPLRTNLFVSSQVPSTKRQITVRFTGQSRIVCPRRDTC